MTIKEYLATRNKMSGSIGEESLNSLIEELRESNPTKEELIEAMSLFLKELSGIYTNGFEACILELEKIDANFMSRRKPPHLK